MLKSEFLRFCDNPEIACCKAEREFEQLRAENTSLREQLAESQRREQAAVESWRGFCSKCLRRDKQYLSDGQMDAVCVTCRANGKCNWQWRGPQAGKGEADGSGAQGD